MDCLKTAEGKRQLWFTYFAFMLNGVLAFLMTGLSRGVSSNFGNYTVNNLAPGKAGYLNGLHAMFSIGAFFSRFS